MATNKKSAPRYDLKAQDRKRNLAIQLGLTAIVVIFAVALVLYIVMGHDKNKGSGGAQAVRITSSALIKKDGSDEPKAVLSLYEDFQCPHCREFEKVFGSTISKFSEVDGVLMPMSFTQRFELPGGSGGAYFAEYKVKTVKINGPIGDDVFAIQ